MMKRTWHVLVLSLSLAACVGTIEGEALTSGGSGTVSYSPPAPDLGVVAVGQPSAATKITLTNTGSSDATNLYVALAIGTQFTISKSSCGTSRAKVTLAGKATCTFDVTFTPASAGPQSDSVLITYDDATGPGQTDQISLSGSGQGKEASLAFAPTTKDFGTVNVGSSSAAQKFTVTNFGMDAASNVSVTLATGTQFKMSGSNCGASLAGGASCTFNVVFSPTNAGSKSDTLTATYDSATATGQTKTAALLGTGQSTVVGPSFSPSSLNFNGVTVNSSSSAKAMTVKNNGTMAASNVYLAIATGTQFAVSGSSCGTASAKISLAAGASCTFNVTFKPTSTGVKTDTLTLTYDQAAMTNQMVTASLAGTGTDPCAGVTCSGHGTCVTSDQGATCNCESGYHASGTACLADGGVYGLSIPADHPSLVFNSSNLAAAKAWYSAHQFSPASDDHVGQALKGLLANDSSSCSTAVSWAKSESAGMDTNGTACDNCRWNGEDIILVYDWCYNLMSASDRSSIEGSADAWINHWLSQDWGGPGMFENNYYWGYLRNEFEWGVTRYDTNPTLANTFFKDVFTTRLGDDFYPDIGAIGGVGQEGAQYGPYVLGYWSVPLITAAQLGRDVWSENPYYLAAVYAYIYETTPNGRLFTWNDNDGFEPSPAASNDIANFMTAAAVRWKSAPAGAYARRWLSNVGVTASRHIQVFDDGTPAPGDLSSLPLDYYASGPAYLFGRSNWGSNGTGYMLVLGAEHGTGHNHWDYGSFTIWRGDWLTRESVGYQGSGVSVVGLGGSGSVDIKTGAAHNTVASGGTLPTEPGDPIISRLESNPEYSFASTNLTPTMGNKHVERDFIFVRSLETMVIFDRGADTVLVHCQTAPAVSGSQATCTNGSSKLVTTSLVGSPSVQVVTEGGQSGQRRIEFKTSGTTQLTVLQALDASGSPLSPTVTDNGTSYHLTLNGSVSIDLVKGASSTGGTITIGGTAHQLTTGVQQMSVTTSGPVWQ